MRAATFGVVLAMHVVFFLLFAALRAPGGPVKSVEDAAAILFFPAPITPVPISSETPAATPPVGPTSAGSRRPRAAMRAAPNVPDTVSPAPKPLFEVPDMTQTPAPDWRADARVAANHVLEAERLKQEQPSLLAPHDYSGVKQGATDYSKPRFGWNHARTHRVEASPGAFVVNINDRCAIALVFIFPFPMCRIGKIPVQGNLFEHMHDLPDPGVPELP